MLWFTGVNKELEGKISRGAKTLLYVQPQAGRVLAAHYIGVLPHGGYGSQRLHD
jgi:hypothetical protein